MTDVPRESELPPDPLGFRVMRLRWQKLENFFALPIPTDEERARQLRAFATSLTDMMRDPSTRERLAREHAWRLEQLITWTARRPW